MNKREKIRGLGISREGKYSETGRKGEGKRTEKDDCIYEVGEHKEGG